MVQVTVIGNDVGQSLKVLKKKMQREGIFREMKLRRCHEKNCEKKARRQAEAIRKVQEATAAGLRAIKEAGADEAVIKLKSLEAFERAADGKATKIIVPSEIQGLAGLVSSIKEVAVDPKDQAE